MPDTYFLLRCRARCRAATESGNIKLASRPTLVGDHSALVYEVLEVLGRAQTRLRNTMLTVFSKEAYQDEEATTCNLGIG